MSFSSLGLKVLTSERGGASSIISEEQWRLDLSLLSHCITFYFQSFIFHKKTETHVPFFAHNDNKNENNNSFIFECLLCFRHYSNYLTNVIILDLPIGLKGEVLICFPLYRWRINGGSVKRSALSKVPQFGSDRT